jgi:hypothetical protein
MILKLKKAPYVYFVKKDRQTTSKSPIKYRIYQWHIDPATGKLNQHMLISHKYKDGFKTRRDAEIVMSKLNANLIDCRPWDKFEIAKI